MRNREAERVREQMYKAQEEERKLLAAVRSAFGLTQYEDRIVSGAISQQGGMTITHANGYRVDGLRELRADLLAAADAARASDALARLTGVKPGHVKLDGAKIVKAVQDAQKRGAVPKPPNQAS